MSKAKKQQPSPESDIGVPSGKGKNSRRTPGLRSARPLSVTTPALLQDGSDIRFRQMIYGLLTIGSRFSSARTRFGRRIGVSGIQYWMLMTIADYTPEPGIRPSELAERLFVSRPFITAQISSLISIGLVYKRSAPTDARVSLLALTDKGVCELQRLTPLIRLANETCFRSFSSEQFEVLCQMVSTIVNDSADASLAIDSFSL